MEKIPEIIHQSWHPHLQPLFDDYKMKLIKENILPKCTFYPKGQDIFRVFKMPLSAIRVVILAQDPYPKAGQANGLAFAVNELIPYPASLKIIVNEVMREFPEITNTNIHPNWRTLEHWWKQGVFLLNTALTVESGNPNSDSGYWSWFTREVVKIISLHNRPVWMMWGSNAKSYIGFTHSYYKWCDKYMGDNFNYVLEAPHPAAETYPNSKTSPKFTGCNHFKICNEILKLKGQSPIKW